MLAYNKSITYSHTGPAGWPPTATRRKIALVPIIRGIPMKSWITLTLALALCTAAHAQATCTYPKAPEAPPDGNTATRDQMIAAKHDFDRYNTEMNSYLDCLKLERDAVS